MRAPHGGWSGRGDRPGRVGCLKWRRRETAGSGTGDLGGVKFGVFPTGSGPQTVPASPQPHLSELGVLRQLPLVSRYPSWYEIGRNGSPLLFHGDADSEAEICQVLPPTPCGLGMAARPSVAGHPLRRARWGRRQVPKTGAGEGGGRSSSRASL